MLNWDCLSTGILVALNTNISTEDHIHIHTVTWYSCRRYETRRIVITTKDLYIALCKDEITRDIIPLSEIVKIEELNTAKDDPPEPASAPLAASRAKSIRPTQPKPNGNTETPEDNTTSMLFSTARHANVIKITTIQGGYNAGRSYSLQAPSSDTCTMVSRPQPLNFSASLSLSTNTHTITHPLSFPFAWETLRRLPASHPRPSRAGDGPAQPVRGAGVQEGGGEIRVGRARKQAGPAVQPGPAPAPSVSPAAR